MSTERLTIEVDLLGRNLDVTGDVKLVWKKSCQRVEFLIDSVEFNGIDIGETLDADDFSYLKEECETKVSSMYRNARQYA